MKIETKYFCGVDKAPSDDWIPLPAPVMRQAIHRVLPAVSTDETRAHVNSVSIEGDGSTLAVVATDGHRLHVSRNRVETPMFHTLVSRAAARVLDAYLEGRKVDEFALHPDGYVRIDGRTFRVESPKVEYPPYRQILPTCAGVSVVFDRLSFRQALILAARIHPDGYRCAKVRVRVGSVRGVTVRLHGDALPFTLECPPAVEMSAPLEFCATARYLITALRCVGGDTVRVYRPSDDPLDPITVVPPGEEVGAESFVALAMPVRP